MYDGEQVSAAEANLLSDRLRIDYRDFPNILALLERCDDWTCYIAYIGGRSKRSEYLRQIERATNANVINLVDPAMIKAGAEAFTEHVSNLIHRTRSEYSPIWDMYNDLSFYRGIHCKALIRALYKFTDKQLRGIYRIIRGEFDRLWSLSSRATVPLSMRKFRVDNNVMNNFAREILRGHNAGVLCVNRINACRSMPHMVFVIRRALRRRAAAPSPPPVPASAFKPRRVVKVVSEAPLDPMTETAIVTSAKGLGAKYATILFRTIPLEQRRAALSHYLDTTELRGTSSNFQTALCEDEYRMSVEHYCSRVQTLYRKAHFDGFHKRLELFAETYEADSFD
jgi:hypothetical protein